MTNAMTAILDCPILTAQHLTTPNGRTRAISSIVLNAQKKPEHEEMIFAWSYALHHMIKSSNKEEIAKHIAPFAVNPLYKNYPRFLLHDYSSSRSAYQQAREEYIKHLALPQVRQLRERQLNRIILDLEKTLEFYRL